jgi:hypothetical protein
MYKRLALLAGMLFMPIISLFASITYAQSPERGFAQTCVAEDIAHQIQAQLWILDRLAEAGQFQLSTQIVPLANPDSCQQAVREALHTALTQSRPAHYNDLFRVFEFETTYNQLAVFEPDTGNLSAEGQGVVSRVIVESLQPGTWDYYLKAHDPFEIGNSLEPRYVNEKTAVFLFDSRLQITNVVDTDGVGLSGLVEKLPEAVFFNGFDATLPIGFLHTEGFANVVIVMDEANLFEPLNLVEFGLVFGAAQKTTPSEFLRAFATPKADMLYYMLIPNTSASESLVPQFTWPQADGTTWAVYRTTQLEDITRLDDANFYGLGVPPSSPYAQWGFRNIASEVGLFYIGRSWDVASGDIDSDGLPDLMLTFHGGTDDGMFTNRDGFMVRYPPNTLVFPPVHEFLDRHSCSWGDINQDGLVDMYCTRGGYRGDGRGRAKELWLQVAPGQFENYGAEYQVEDYYGRGRYSVMFDANQDGFLDIYVVNEFPRSDGQLSDNVLYINQEGLYFVEDETTVLRQEIGGRCVKTADLNHDSWMDVVVCGDGTGVFIFSGGPDGFTDVTAEMGLVGTEAIQINDIALTDIDQDGDIDIVGITPRQVLLYRLAKGRYKPAEIIHYTQVGRRLAVLDVDLDGDDDIYVVTSAQGCTHVNITSETPDWILLNQGRVFVELALPTSMFGCGDDVEVIDIDQDGVQEIVVLNGFVEGRGPLEVWDYNPGGFSLSDQ